tara:strand:- start:2164 stop:2775 length:612 start_codon:yes stop_codon:yes gene_type:complete
MAKRMTDTDKWKKGFIRSLPSKYKLFWLYILDDCNHAGVWETDFEVASIRIGSKITEKEAAPLLASQIKIFDDGNKWFIPKFNDFQYGTLNENSRVHQSVIKIIDRYDLYNIKGIEPTLKETVKKPIIKRFKEPTVDEVYKYCTDRNNKVDCDKFHNYYISNGWMVGRNKMKDWRGAVRHWESNTPKDKTGRKELAGKDYNKF